jgi:hypothetical protein
VKHPQKLFIKGCFICHLFSAFSTSYLLLSPSCPFVAKIWQIFPQGILFIDSATVRINLQKE